MAELANSSVVEYVFKHKQNHMFEELYEKMFSFIFLKVITAWKN